MGILAYLSICIFWGLSSTAVKFGLEYIEPFSFSFFRFLTTAGILLVYNLGKGKSIHIKKNDMKVIFTSATAMFFVNSMMIMFATKRLDAGIVPIILSLVPVMMVIIESILERRLLVGPIGILGILGGIVGISVISFGGSTGAKIDLLGLVYLGIGILAWSTGSVYLRHRTIETSVTVLLMYQALTPLVYFGALIFAKGGLGYELKWTAFAGMFYMAIADTILGTASYVYLLKNWKVSIVASYAYINPIVGLIGAFLLLGESISMQKILGMLIILFAVFLIQWEEKIRTSLTALKQKKIKP